MDEFESSPSGILKIWMYDSTVTVEKYSMEGEAFLYLIIWHMRGFRQQPYNTTWSKTHRQETQSFKLTLQKTKPKLIILLETDVIKAKFWMSPDPQEGLAPKVAEKLYPGVYRVEYIWRDVGGREGISSQNDELLIFCYYYPYISGTCISRPKDVHENECDQQTLVKELELTPVEPVFCDFKFVVGGQNFITHKCILVARSEVFKEFFDGSGRNSDEIVVHTSPEVMRAILYYQYAGLIKGTDANFAFEVMRVAERMGFKSLVKKCIELFEGRTTVDDIHAMLEVAKKDDAICSLT